MYHKTEENEDEYIAEVNKEWRSSSSAFISGDDKVAQCLSKRMKALLGNIQHKDTEWLQLVRYEGGERFRLHQRCIQSRLPGPAFQPTAEQLCLSQRQLLWRRDLLPPGPRRRP